MPKANNTNRPKPRSFRKKNPGDNPSLKENFNSSNEKIRADEKVGLEKEQLNQKKALDPNAKDPDKKEPDKKEPSTENLKEQYEALNRKYQFLMADYANYKKNSLKKISNFRKYEGENLIKGLLQDVMDNFDRALEKELNTQNLEDFKKGVFMIYENLKKLLKENGIKALECQGKAFDPMFHYALDSAPSEKVPPEHILQVVKKAYLFHDKLIRPAEVIVAKKPSKDHFKK